MGDNEVCRREEATPKEQRDVRACVSGMGQRVGVRGLERVVKGGRRSLPSWACTHFVRVSTTEIVC